MRHFLRDKWTKLYQIWTRHRQIIGRLKCIWSRKLTPNFVHIRGEIIKIYASAIVDDLDLS